MGCRRKWRLYCPSLVLSESAFEPDGNNVLALTRMKRKTCTNINSNINNTVPWHKFFFHPFLYFAMIAWEGLLLLCSSCMCAVFGACQLSPHVWKTCCQNANGSRSSQWWTSHTQICFHVAEELLYNLNYNSLPLRRRWWLQSYSRMNKGALRYWS